MKKLLAILALAGAGWLTGAANAAITLSKTAASPTVNAGGTITYTITLHNTGALVGSPDVTDTLPAGEVFLSVTAPDFAAGCTTPAVGTNGTVECFGVSVPANGTQTITLVTHVNASLPAGTVLTNPAHAVATQGDTVFTADASNNVTVTANVAAQLRSFAAVATARGVSLRWQVASQVDVLGFNVYRQVGAVRTRVNSRLIGAHRASGYSLLDRRARRATPARYWLQIVNLDGSRRWYGPARVSASAR